jgi:hypothetical protein
VGRKKVHIKETFWIMKISWLFIGFWSNEDLPYLRENLNKQLPPHNPQMWAWLKKKQLNCFLVF